MSSNLVARLAEALNRVGINYCHWKSNIDLARATSGETDLDLLVERASYPAMLSILASLGFKSAMVRRGENPPGISHYYGYDAPADRYIHVHLFSRILTGESFSKSHLLPFDAMLLRNTRCVGPLRVASKPAELVLFTVRTFIKYGSLPDAARLWKETEKIKEELRWLRDGGDLSTSICLLEQYCPVIEEPLFLACLDALEKDAPLLHRVWLARKVRKRIQNYARRSTLGRISAYAKLAFVQAQRRLEGSKANKVLQSGGSVVALVGADATGKSTLVSETGRWLGEKFVVRVIHAGKPPPFWATRPVDWSLRLARRFWPRLSATVNEQHLSSGKQINSKNGKGLTSLLFAFRAVTLAWDRKNLLLKGRRAAARGKIVICDRYPSNIIGAMDSPRLRATNTANGWISSVYNRAARLEGRLYAQIPPPDIAIRLQVSVETAKERNRARHKPGAEPEAYIESRHKRAGEWRRTDAGKVFDVNTERSLPETICEVKEILWRAL